MKATAKRVVRVEDAQGLPDGEHPGEWSGYKCRFPTEHGQYEADIDTGIRGRVRCRVVVRNGVVIVESIPGSSLMG